ncbi:MAG: M81 family metallopeptidase [Verrucomicrobia bacterium]|nr:M81 family metallopeptidase [Verrucomicrobiota bacterium]
MSKRILIAGLFHETHTFLEGTTGLRDFQVMRGAEMLCCTGDSSPLGGVLESAQEFGWEVLPTVDFRAQPSAIVEDAVFEIFWREFTVRAQLELARGVDAIYLVLHGAMVTQSLDDVEGELLARIRKLPGAERLPIFGVFDLHANFTQRMADGANCLVAYRENPHTDARQAAQDAVALLQRAFETGQVPRMFWQHPPVMWPPTGTGTASDPMRALERTARAMEAASPNLLAVNAAAGFSFADIAETGVSFSIATVGPEEEARARLGELCELALKFKEQGNVTDSPVADVMKKILPLAPGLTVLVEPSDNIGGGAPGDGTGLLRALVEHRVPNAAIAINDPAAVRQFVSRALGAKATLPIGGKGSRLDAGPLTLEVELISRSNGRFELEDKQSHLASMAGDRFDMGPCAVVRHGGLTILLTSRKTPPFDLGQWRSQGVEPAKLSVVAVKAAVAHRRAYDPIAARMLWVDTPGPCTSNLRALPYRKVQRPIFPLDK